mmetsp:Transcript_31253/g.44929  ORF Transcript_31253/g.44929 Transcript_31253/m.44929 type:complete len:84 (-) Transcript_31253:90-341(-)
MGSLRWPYRWRAIRNSTSIFMLSFRRHLQQSRQRRILLPMPTISPNKYCAIVIKSSNGVTIKFLFNTISEHSNNKINRNSNNS